MNVGRTRDVTAALPQPTVWHRAGVAAVPVATLGHAALSAAQFAITSLYRKGSVVVAQSAVALLIYSANVHPASAQKRDIPSSSQRADDHLIVRFNSPVASSIREQHVNASIFNILLEDRAANLPDVRPCSLRVRAGHRFGHLDLTVSNPNEGKRTSCLQAVVRFVLDAPVNENEFRAARASSIASTAAWTNPSPRFAKLAVEATARLGYLAIYQKDSPLHELYSITEDDYLGLSFQSFSEWLARVRQKELLTIDASGEVLERVGRSAPQTTEVTSLSSSRVFDRTLYFSGERFGFPALIMVRLAEEAAAGLQQKEIWKRLHCNQSGAMRFDEPLKSNSLSSITCFSQRIFGTDAWLGLAIQLSQGADDLAFCKEVQALANDDQIVSLTRERRESPGPIYILLPPKCESEK